MAVLISCEEAGPFPRRSQSVGVRGRYGSNDEAHTVSSQCGAFRVVERHTFLDLEFDEFAHDEGDGKDYCNGSKVDWCDWETASNVTTEPPSTDAHGSSEGSESDNEVDTLGLPPSCPPGHFQAQSVQQVAIVGVMQPTFFCMPHVGVAQPCASGTQIEIPKRKKRPTMSAWGAERKKKMSQGKESYTTIMLKNLPAKCTNVMMMEMLDSAGLVGKYNFVYAPTDFRDYTSFGYAFVNMVSHDAALQAMEALEDLLCPTWSEQTVAFEVCWSEPHQGLNAHVKRYQNSPVMHPDVLREYKPVLLKGGVVQQFPAPTKRIREPRLRRSCPQHDA